MCWLGQHKEHSAAATPEAGRPRRSEAWDGLCKAFQGVLDLCIVRLRSIRRVIHDQRVAAAVQQPEFADSDVPQSATWFLDGQTIVWIAENQSAILHVRERLLEPRGALWEAWHWCAEEPRVRWQQWFERLDGPRLRIEASAHLLPEFGVTGTVRGILQIADVLAVMTACPEGGPPPENADSQPGRAMDVSQEAEYAEVTDVERRFLTRMYAQFEATAGRPCSDRGSGCSSLPS